MGKVNREKFKVYEGVFDNATLDALENLKRRQYYDELGGPIKTGKEGDVYHAHKGDTRLAIKMFRITSANFKKISQYIIRDFRFRTIKGNLRKVILAWSQKEFRNLQLLYKAGVNVPYPYKQFQNVIIMDYIEGCMLKDAIIENPEEIYKQVKEQLHLMIRGAKLVHGDLSEFNMMLNSEGVVIIIDVGQAMNFKNKQDFLEFEDLLLRDLENVCRFFNKKFGFNVSSQELLNELKEGLFD
ncbi:MAG: serine protein kinase RIO [Nanoarchaeota archaeon]|nr:serine protein kinase RIO [Nanoarchaeota archaeon]